MRTRLKFSGTTTNNYSVDAVYNGSDALDYAESGVYDCILLDIMMPKLDGLSVLKAIREQKNTVPVLRKRSDIYRFLRKRNGIRVFRKRLYPDL